MTDFRSLHREAISYAKKGSDALSQGDRESYIAFYTIAYELESEAAQYFVSLKASEPTRSVLYRSAATAAFNIGKYVEAKHLIHEALSGSPYPELANELETLLNKVNLRIELNSTKEDAIENSYIDFLKERAVNLRLYPTDKKYSKAILVDHVIEFLKSVQNCFLGFSQVNFEKNFTSSDFSDYSNVLTNFKKNVKTLCVDFQFNSFGVSIVADTEIMNFTEREFYSEKFISFKRNLFEDFKNEVIYPDYQSVEFQNFIKNKYDPEERALIYSPFLDSLKANKKYKIQLSNNDFTEAIMEYPVITQRIKDIITPKIKKPQVDEELQLQRTLEVVTESGVKKGILSQEQMKFGEFDVPIRDLKYNEDIISFVEPYSLSIIFDKGVLRISDERFDLLFENTDNKKLIEDFSKSIITLYKNLLSKENDLGVDDKEKLLWLNANTLRNW